ncbi:MAG: metallophosphoesterase [Candidatus Kapabacteria bacterium]|nr:metallophosphoesterase [Candidatus Kapabacteria bacterium]
MDPKRWILFILSTAALQFLIDVYVIRAWQSFVKSHGWSAWLYRPLWAICIALLVLSPYISYQRSNHARLEEWMFILFIVATLWYLPKLPIATVLLVRDITRGCVWLWNKIIPQRKQMDVQHETVAMPSRRAALQASAWGMAAIPFIIVGKGIANADNITVHEHDIELPKLSSAFDGIRIAQISDIHAGSWRDAKPFGEARRIIEQLKPDLLLITGDFVNFQADELKIIRTELERLKAPMGVWASLGNHDHYSRNQDHTLLKSVIKNTGIRLLVNENHSFDVNGEKLQLIGTDNTGLGQTFADLPAALVGVDVNYPTILMAHDPTFWDKEVREKTMIDLMLSGHTHGGQVGMTFMGTEYSVAQLVYKQWAGLYNDGGQFLYVNRGLGTVGPPIRIGIPPEVTLLTLRKQKPLLG